MTKKRFSSFKSSTTAQEVIEDCPTLENKNVFITGASSGIGYETAVAISNLKPTCLYLLIRKNEKNQELVTTLKKQTENDNIKLIHIDLTSFKSVKKCTKKIGDVPVHILINNAGVWCSNDRSITDDNWETTFQTNYLSNYLLCNLLWNNFQPNTRVVNVSGDIYKKMGTRTINFDDINGEKNFSGMTAYCQSKLANVLFSKILNEKLKEENKGRSYSLHPGVIHTNLARNMKYPKWLTNTFYFLGSFMMKNLEQGAATTVFVSCHESLSQHEIVSEGGTHFNNCDITDGGPADDIDLAQKLWDVTATEYLKDQLVN